MSSVTPKDQQNPKPGVNRGADKQQKQTGAVAAHQQNAGVNTSEAVAARNEMDKKINPLEVRIREINLRLDEISQQPIQEMSRNELDSITFETENIESTIQQFESLNGPPLLTEDLVNNLFDQIKAWDKQNAERDYVHKDNFPFLRNEIGREDPNQGMSTKGLQIRRAIVVNQVKNAIDNKDTSDSTEDIIQDIQNTFEALKAKLKADNTNVTKFESKQRWIFFATRGANGWL